MQLDTNVSCPEGINEVLAEDDVSWQIKKVCMWQLRIRFGAPATSLYKHIAEPMCKREDADIRYETIDISSSRVL